MQDDIERVLIPQAKIAARVQELARQIAADHSSPQGPRDITIIPILTGAMIFCGDLIRQLNFKMKIGLVTVSSYPGTSLRSQGASVLEHQVGNIAGRNVLLVDDILDSGDTLSVVLPFLEKLQPASLKTCVLLRKDRPIVRKVNVDYIGFDIPDEFVVGYGLDYNNYYRNLPDIVTLKHHVVATPLKTHANGHA